MADNNNNSSNDIDLHQTAAAFMDKIMGNERVQHAHQHDAHSDDDEYKPVNKSKYDDHVNGHTNGIPEPGHGTMEHNSSSGIPEPGHDALEDNSSSGIPEPGHGTMEHNTSSGDDSELLEDRLVAILNRGYSSESAAPEPGNETMQRQASNEPETRQIIDRQRSVDNDLHGNPENVNDHRTPEPGQAGFAEEPVKIVVDRAPNVDQSEMPDFDPEESYNHSSAPEPSSPQAELVFSAPEPSSDFHSGQEYDAPEPGNGVMSFAPEPSQTAVFSAPEPTERSVSSAPEPTANGAQPKMISEEEKEEEEDSFPASVPFRGAGRIRPSARRQPWHIPEEPNSQGSLDRFGTIRQNIRSGNTSSLRDMWEKMGKI